MGRERELDDDSKTSFGCDGAAEDGMRSAKRTPMSFSEVKAGEEASAVRV